MSLISIIIPMYNENEIASYSLEKLIEIGNRLDDEYEIIVINDGSNDETEAIIESFAAENEKIKLISFSRNFGHQMAISAGLDFASGDAVVIIDGDLQDPPELIPDMVDKWKEGWHVVYGKRRSRKGESWFKLITAKIYYKVLSKLIDIDIPENVGDFRLMDKMVVKEFRNLHERHRYVRGMVTWLGFRQTEILYDRVERIAGKTSREIYEIRNMLNQPHHSSFLTVGSMGHCSSIALGISLAQPDKEVFCVDGDGALIMHMGSLATVGMTKPKNFKHILINNKVHESVGGQHTAAAFINMPELAKANGYKTIFTVDEKSQLKDILPRFIDSKGPSFLELFTQPGSRNDLGRPKNKLTDYKKIFMKYIKN